MGNIKPSIILHIKDWRESVEKKGEVVEVAYKDFEFPMTREKFKQNLKEAKIKTSGDILICDYEVLIGELPLLGIFKINDGWKSRLDLHGLNTDLNFNDLNYLAYLLSNFDEDEVEKYNAITFYEDINSKKCESIRGIIEIIENFDGYNYISCIYDEEQLGEYTVECGRYDISAMGELEKYFNYEMLGEDIADEEGGVFTNAGYVSEIKSHTWKEYTGENNMSKDYKGLQIK